MGFGHPALGSWQPPRCQREGERRGGSGEAVREALRQRVAPAWEPPSDKRAQEQEFIPVNMFALFILSIFINHNRRDICC